MGALRMCDKIPHFADIAGPRVVFEDSHRLIGDAIDLLVHALSSNVRATNLRWTCWYPSWCLQNMKLSTMTWTQIGKLKLARMNRGHAIGFREPEETF
jgi:hypothetical protein